MNIIASEEVLMDILELMRSRHSVRRYTDEPLPEDKALALSACIAGLNEESKLSMQLILNEPAAFGSVISKISSFANVTDYIAIVGKDSPDLEEKAGYYGEKAVLEATKLGLGTCWVAASFNRAKCTAVVGEGERLVIVIAVGIAEEEGRPHRSKTIDELCTVEGPMPDWFVRGLEAASLAPTAMNRQAFRIVLDGASVSVRTSPGPYSKIDSGIVRCHFELAAGTENYIRR